LESCLKTYTKVDILTDFQCRKCTLVATLEAMEQELAAVMGKDEERSAVLTIDIGRIKDALKSNIEATLVCNPIGALLTCLFNSFFI
jgi:hypothetical protein